VNRTGAWFRAIEVMGLGRTNIGTSEEFYLDGSYVFAIRIISGREIVV